MSGRRRCQPRAFTLLELLLVVSILGVLVGLLVPAVQSAREASFRAACQNNLRQVGTAVQNRVSVTGSFPPLWAYSLFWKGGQPSGSLNNWTPYLLPYLGETAVADAYDLNAMFYENTQAIACPLKVLQCPSAPRPADLVTETGWMPSRVAGVGSLSALDPYFTATFTAAPTDYSGFTKVSDDWKDLLGYPPGSPDLASVLATPPYPSAGGIANWLAGGVLPVQAALRRPGDVTDGLSNSVLLIEEGGRPQSWANGRPSPTAPPVRYSGWADPGGEFSVLQGDTLNETLINLSNKGGIYSFHPAGANFPFADGSVRFLSKSVSARTLVALLTCASGDTPDAAEQ